MTIKLLNQVVVFPHLTTAERLALTPAEGSIVYDTIAKHYYYWDSVQWVEY